MFAELLLGKTMSLFEDHICMAGTSPEMRYPMCFTSYTADAQADHHGLSTYLHLLQSITEPDTCTLEASVGPALRVEMLILHYFRCTACGNPDLRGILKLSRPLINSSPTRCCCMLCKTSGKVPRQ
ncbi:hypothetical protein N656DRAFT_773863 [Canariomyces notabilis]|uniref:Uncharacterized protein n=1 Tax=Canariomyces notabilis TaxID=2074819 RepID=A0AAN6TNG2_9PEZI|nr:hypothetical protein N656DRAFT_773863 [Canariomyces arenarius]